MTATYATQVQWQHMNTQGLKIMQRTCVHSVGRVGAQDCQHAIDISRVGTRQQLAPLSRLLWLRLAGLIKFNLQMKITPDAKCKSLPPLLYQFQIKFTEHLTIQDLQCVPNLRSEHFCLP